MGTDLGTKIYLSRLSLPKKYEGLIYTNMSDGKRRENAEIRGVLRRRFSRVLRTDLDVRVRSSNPNPPQQLQSMRKQRTRADEVIMLLDIAVLRLPPE